MRIVLLIFLIILSLPAQSQVHEFTLDNGLKLLVKEDHRAPVVVSMVWYNVGSADEAGGITGVSHALEHLMFKGTAKFPRGVFSKTIAEIGGQENAFTNTDYTVYFEKLAASQLPTSFELEADRMQNLLLDNNEFAKEIKVIREERRLRTENNPQNLTFERFLATAHLSSPYQHPVIGWMHDLYQLKTSDLKTWYQRYYGPNNATVVVVGDVNSKEVYRLAVKYFGQIPSRTISPRKLQIEPPSLGKKFVRVNAPAQSPLLLLGYTVPSRTTAKAPWESYALEIIAYILDGGESSRFAKDLVRGSHLASNAGVSYNLYSRYQTQFILLGTPSQGHPLAALKTAILKEVERLRNEPVGEAELKRIKTQIIAQKTFEKESIFAQAMELGLLQTLGLGWQLADGYVDNINQVSAAQIQQAAQRYFQQQALTQAQLIPLKKEA